MYILLFYLTFRDTAFLYQAVTNCGFRKLVCYNLGLLLDEI